MIRDGPFFFFFFESGLNHWQLYNSGKSHSLWTSILHLQNGKPSLPHCVILGTKRGEKVTKVLQKLNFHKMPFISVEWFLECKQTTWECCTGSRSYQVSTYNTEKKNTTPQQIWVVEEQKKKIIIINSIRKIRVKKITVLITMVIMIIAAIYWVLSMGQASSQARRRYLPCACPTRALLELVGTGLGGWLLNIQEFSELSLNCS